MCTYFRFWIFNLHSSYVVLASYLLYHYLLKLSEKKITYTQVDFYWYYGREICFKNLTCIITIRQQSRLCIKIRNLKMDFNTRGTLHFAQLIKLPLFLSGTGVCFAQLCPPWLSFALLGLAQLCLAFGFAFGL